MTERSADGTSLLTYYHPQLANAVGEEFLQEVKKLKRHRK